MKRILLKLSGEALAGSRRFGFDEATVTVVAKQVKSLCTGRNSYWRRQFLARTYQ